MARKRRSSPGPYLMHLEVIRERIPNPNSYPYNLPAFKNLTRLPFHPKVTFLVGENGSGKSTLLEAVAVGLGLNAEGGSENFTFDTRASHSSLSECLRLARTASQPADRYFLRAESYFNVATEIERLDTDPKGGPPIIKYYGGVSLHEQSHGESFFALFKNRFGDHGLYLMDEPEAALSPARQLQFIALMHQYILGGCQFVIATHSPIIMAYPEACIYLLDNQGLREVAYTETEHYQITRAFLTHTKRSLDELLRDD
jgi:predicted ATPase